jgi:hypothetical protein
MRVNARTHVSQCETVPVNEENRKKKSQETRDRTHYEWASLGRDSLGEWRCNDEQGRTRDQKTKGA